MRSTPKKTAQQIIESGNDYLGALKGNHGKFFKALKLYFQSETHVHIFVAAPADPGFPEDGEYLNFVLFWSSRRKLDERVNASIASFAEITLEEYDALFVAIKPYYFLGYPKPLKEGKTYHFQTPAFTDMQADGKVITSTPTFVGVDYFFLSPRS
jgi:hypothetical protein